MRQTLQHKQCNTFFEAAVEQVASTGAVSNWQMCYLYKSMTKTSYWRSFSHWLLSLTLCSHEGAVSINKSEHCVCIYWNGIEFEGVANWSAKQKAKAHWSCEDSANKFTQQLNPSIVGLQPRLAVHSILHVHGLVSLTWLFFKDIQTIMCHVCPVMRQWEKGPHVGDSSSRLSGGHCLFACFIYYMDTNICVWLYVWGNQVCISF